MTNQGDVVRIKSRGWLSLAASIGLIFMSSALWLYINGAMAVHGSFNPANENLIGEIFVIFAMLVVCGITGVANAMMQIRNGRRSVTLTFLMFVAVFAAIFMGAVTTF